MDEKLPFKMENDPFYRLGLAKGLLKHARNTVIEIAIRMKESNMPVDQIAKYTKLSIEGNRKALIPRCYFNRVQRRKRRLGKE